MKQLDLGLTLPKTKTTISDVFLFALMIAYVVILLFSINFEEGGLIQKITGMFVFNLFPSYEEFRLNNWYLVEWSQWLVPITLLVMSVSFIYTAVNDFKKIKLNNEHLILGLLGFTFWSFVVYQSVNYALNF